MITMKQIISVSFLVLFLTASNALAQTASPETCKATGEAKRKTCTYVPPEPGQASGWCSCHGSGNQQVPPASTTTSTSRPATSVPPQSAPPNSFVATGAQYFFLDTPSNN